MNPFLVVAFFTAATLAPFWGKAFHVDEPFFLAIARHILQDPWHPLAFEFNWYGRSVPMAGINNTPPLLAYLLAGLWKLTAGREWAMRACLLPLDLASSWSLYLLAARFLKRPLLPTLIVLAAPAYLINMNHLMAEKLMAAFVFPALYALVRGVDDESPRWFWTSAVLLAAALMSKYAALFAVLPIAVYALRKGVPRARLLAYLVMAGLPAAAYVLGSRAWGAAWEVTAAAARLPTASWPHKLRSLAAFLGGCGVVTALWPLLWLRRRGTVLAVSAGLALLLFLPGLDLAPLVRSVDRLTGWLLAAGGIAGVWLLWKDGRGDADRGLWLPWVFSVLFLQAGLYWSVMSRQMLFLLPPLVFGLAARLEADLAPGRCRRIMLVSVAATVSLSLCLALVDCRYASAQKGLAREVRRTYIDSGRRVWFVGHWGLQHYLEAAGARQLDASRGGWDDVRAGDVVVVSRVNSNPIPLPGRRLANVREYRIGTPIPLRLISGWTGEAGFYSNVTGFLPYSLSAEPLEEFRIIEIL
jgi:hypothetical protein